HIVSDGTSHMILTEDFHTIYNGTEIPHLRLQYKDFCQWQNRLNASKEIKTQEDHWLDLYPRTGEIPRLNLLTDYKRPEVFTNAGASHSFTIPPFETGRFKALAADCGGTLFMNFLAILNTLFYKYTGQTDIIIGTGIAGRPHAELQQIVGMFINTLAMRHFPRGEKEYRTFFSEVIDRSIQAYENQDVQFETLVDKLEPERDLSRNPLFDISLVVQNFSTSGREEDTPRANRDTEFQDSEKKPAALKSGKTTAKFDLTFFINPSPEEIHIDIEYYTGIFKPGTIQRLATHFMSIINTVIDNPTVALENISIITENEKHRLLYEFNDTNREFPSEKTIHQLFEEQVARTSDSIAIVGGILESPSLQHTQSPSGTKHPATGSQTPSVLLPTTYRLPPTTSIIQLTYRELNEKANRIALYLQNKKGMKPGDRIGVLMTQSLNRVPAILGILKAGGTYVPLESSLPPERLKFMIDDAVIPIVLSEENNLELSKRLFRECEFFHSFLCMDTSDSLEPGENVNGIGGLDLKIQSTAPAYIIYTSGTTGKPKGVVLEHRGMANLNTKFTADFKITGRDRIIQFAGISFDASVYEIFMALLNGAVLHLLDPGTIGDYSLFQDYLDRHDITIATLPPPYANSLAPESMQSLRMLITAGSSPNLDFIKKCSLHLEYINAFGPTESTICCSYWSSREAGDIDNITIGKPISNTKLYIADSNLKLQPVGVAGQLCISGVSLARGYLNNPQLTSEKFTPYGGDLLKDTPSFPNNQYPITGNQLFQTGDLCRWLPDGNIEYLGRIDHQVKIRGFRIELGEIEARLLAHPKIKEAVVIARESKKDDQFLCAYYVTEGTPQQVADIRAFLSQYLPDYMIPSFFINLERIPLTSNGKIDSKALSEYQVSNIQSKAYTAPQNEIENKLTAIWADILDCKKEKISIEEDFFRLGGHSLKATLLVSRIHKEFNVKLPLVEIFKTPFIRTIGEIIKRQSRSSYETLEPIEKKQYYPLSSAQKRVYFLQQMDLNSTAYNMPFILPIGKEIETVRLEAALRGLIDRHESLRTSFEFLGQEPVQRVHDSVEFDIVYFDEAPEPVTSTQTPDHLNAVDTARSILNTFVKPFDLNRAPLIRAGLIKHADGNHTWLVDMHHI
ncbi:MAG: amino acid adenylation domain-containing protein, partial [bacterium]|nr:amino acid adenylation domain-containing protein [bacterium]